MTTTANNGRIQAVDALRGFAVMGIILLHNIEHFNFYSFPETTGALQALDGTIWDFLFFSFSGKAYAIFALLFGFTFYLQSRSSNRRGEDFKNRYMWRLVLLLLFGFINASFFPGEILVLYAILGFVLVPVRHISDRALFITLAILMLQPLEWAKVAYAAVNPAANPEQMIFSLVDVYPQLEGNNFWEMVKVNFVTGQLASLNWAWCYGRVFQTCALFMLGLLLGSQRTVLFGRRCIACPFAPFLDAHGVHLAACGRNNVLCQAICVLANRKSIHARIGRDYAQFMVQPGFHACHDRYIPAAVLEL